MNSPESILEPTGNGLKVPHATCTSRLAALRLLSPLIRTQLSRWVSALCACCIAQFVKQSRVVLFRMPALVCNFFWFSECK